MGTAILQEIVQLVTGGLTGIATGIGSGLQELVKNIMIVTEGSGSSATYHLSTFGTVVIVFAGVSLAFGLFRWTLNFVTSLGNRNR